MATAVKIKKIIEVLLTDDLNLSEVEVESMPVGAYLLSRARGVYKFTCSEEAYNAFIATKEAAAREAAEAKAAKQAEEAARIAAEQDVEAEEAPVEEAEEAHAEEVEETPVEEVEEAPVEEVEEAPVEEVEETPVEEVEETPVEEVEEAPVEEVEETPAEECEVERIAAERGLTEVDFTDMPKIFKTSTNELFMWLPENQVFMSLASITNENGDAYLGEKPVANKSPKAYAVLLEKIGATIPTKNQYDEFVALLLRATGAVTVEGFNHVCGFISLKNQLCTDDGKFKSNLGEYKNLLENFPVFNLECRKVLV